MRNFLDANQTTVLSTEFTLVGVREILGCPRHTFYRLQLFRSTCCDNSCGQAGEEARALCDTLWQAPDCDIPHVPVSVGLVPCESPGCPTPHSTALENTTSATCAARGKSLSVTDIPISGDKEPGQSTQAKRGGGREPASTGKNSLARAASSTGPNDRTLKRPKLTRVEFNSATHSPSVNKCVASLVGDILLGAKYIAEKQDEVLNVHPIIDPASKMTVEELGDFLWERGNEKQRDGFVDHLRLCFVVLMQDNDLSQPKFPKNRKTHLKKLASILVGVIKGLVAKGTSNAFGILACLTESRMHNPSFHVPKLADIDKKQTGSVATQIIESLWVDNDRTWSKIPLRKTHNPVWYIHYNTGQEITTIVKKLGFLPSLYGIASGTEDQSPHSPVNGLSSETNAANGLAAWGGPQQTQYQETSPYPLMENGLPQATTVKPNQQIWTGLGGTHPVVRPSTLVQYAEAASSDGQPRLSRSPSPIRTYLVSENLFRTIKFYFENVCRNMIFDDHGTLLTQEGAEFHSNLCNDFDSYCYTATMFKEKGLRDEFGRALSKASALVEQMLRAEHPRTLACFFEVFIHLGQTGLFEVTLILRAFVKNMSAKVMTKENPWRQICQLLGELDPESLGHSMARAWKCTTDVFDSELGTFTRLAVSVRLDYIKRVVADPLEEEGLLRESLAQLGSIHRLPIPRVMLNLAHNLNRQGRFDEAEQMGLKVSHLLQEDELYAMRIVERIESLKVVSRSQFIQGNSAAEQTMREAIRMISNNWGIRHSWVPEFMTVLEGWLRGWGRDEDANTLQGEIEELIAQDVIDQ